MALTAPPVGASPEAVDGLLKLLKESPYNFYQPAPETHEVNIPIAKRYLDPLATEISQQQLARLRENRKRKRHKREDEHEVLRLRKIHTQGFGCSQIWEQARRVLAAAVTELNADLNDLDVAARQQPQINGNSLAASDRLLEGGEKSDIESDFDSGDAVDQEDQASGWHDLDEDDGDFDEGSSRDEEVLLDDIDANSSDENEQGRADAFIEDVHGLNDGFFSIDDFNRQTEFLEQVDARGDLDDGAASDEEDIDWDAAPPMGEPLNGTRRFGDAEIEAPDSDENDGDGEGPTFGDMDLDASGGVSDDENQDIVFEDGDRGVGDNLMYADFFAPPARKADKSRKHGKYETSKSREEGFIPLNAPEDDVQRISSAVHGDLFSDGEASDEEVPPDDSSGARSTHERRQAALLQRIRQLEAANVAKREWTLSGEARAADRPVNSLLAEDLDFERAGKPVPVITKEITEDIEAMIKRRILTKEFDEVLRRRPDEALSGILGRRGVLEEVQDTKSKKGLAELYEDEHLRRTDPAYVDARDERLKAEHREVESMWKDVSAQLDALANWNYRPRPVEMSIQVRNDAPALVMEDARPGGVGGGELATTSQLAPQEVYKPGQTLQKGEVATKGGTVLAKDELSREDKKRLKRRAKERARKAGANPTAPAADTKQSAKKQEGNRVARELKHGGVMIVDRKGNLATVDGKTARSNRAFVTAGSLKL